MKKSLLKKPKLKEVVDYGCRILGVPRPFFYISRKPYHFFWAQMRGIFLVPNKWTPNTIFHELIHWKQFLERDPNVYTNYGCLLGNDYWNVYRSTSWKIEREAIQAAEIMTQFFFKARLDV